MSASPIIPATDPLKTYTRLVPLGANVQQASELVLGLSLSTRLVHCQKLITRLTLEARTDLQGVPRVANGLGAHCADSDGILGINYLGKPRSSSMDFTSNVPEGTTMAQVAGPDAIDGIKDLTVGMATVVNATATGAARERFAIVSLGYAGKEIKLDSIVVAGNSTAGRGNATAAATVSVKSNGVWKQSESSAAGCVLTSIEAVYPEYISGVRLLFACPAATQGGSGDSRAFVLASASSSPATTGSGSSGADASVSSGLSSMTFVAIGVGIALLAVIGTLIARLGCKRRRSTKMFDPKV